MRRVASLLCLVAAACQSPAYFDKQPPEDFFDPGKPSSGGYPSGYVPDAGDPQDQVDAGPPQCAEAQRKCPREFKYTGTDGVKAVEVRGSFDGWGTGKAMTKAASSNEWSATVEVPWNTKVVYKFVVDGKWIVDPANPKTEDDGYGGKNSVLDAATCTSWTCGALTCTAASCTGETPVCNATSGACECTAGSCGSDKYCNAATRLCEAVVVGDAPRLILAVPPTIGADSYSFQVRFVPGKSAAALDAAKTVVRLNGAAATVPYDAATKTFSVSVTGAKANKYAYFFQVQDTAGVKARLFVPFWVEAKPFTWKDAFLYQIMTDRFVNGDVTNDAPVGVEDAAEWKGGDFRGVIQKLDYFQALGSNAIWLSSPISSTSGKEPGKGEGFGHTFSGYHAYWPIATGWTYDNEWPGMVAIEKRFGTDADLKELVNKAHERGLRVLVDFVPNHVHKDAPLFQQHGTDSNWFNLPYLDCSSYWDKVPENKYCWFDPFLPDFNTQNDTVNQTVAAHAVWLIQEFNLDGFRVDATKHVYNQVLVAMRSKIVREVSTTGLHFYMVGESLGGNVAQVTDCMGPDKLDGSVNDPLHYAILDVFLTRKSSAAELENAIRYDEATWTRNYPAALMGHFLGSHDTARAISIANNYQGGPWADQPTTPTEFRPFGRLRTAFGFLLTYNSIPIIWMGDEYGQPGSRDPDNRRMMKFDTDLTALQKETLEVVQKIGKARAAHSALRRGSRKTLAMEKEFFAFSRSDGDDVVLVGLNVSENEATKTLDLTGLGLAAGTVLTDAVGGGTFTVQDSKVTVTLGGLSPAVLSK